MSEVQGVLVHGSNHFIVNGPRPDAATARLLIRKWELPLPGASRQWPPQLDAFSICARAFRENLSWAVVLEGAGEPSAAVRQLLSELEARGVAIDHAPGPLGASA